MEHTCRLLVVRLTCFLWQSLIVSTKITLNALLSSFIFEKYHLILSPILMTQEVIWIALLRHADNYWFYLKIEQNKNNINNYTL